MIKLVKEKSVKISSNHRTKSKKKLLPIKEILKTVTSRVLIITLKFCKYSVLEKKMVKELSKMEKDKIVLRKVPPALFL